MMIELDELLSAATHAARLGGDVLARYFQGGVVMRDKSADGGKSYDLVSDADVESELVIGNYLSSRFPSHELLGEESLSGGDVDAEDLWIIDPLDGTNNFAHQLPHFAVSIAYYHRGQAMVGVVLNPIRDDLYVTARGCGAHFNGKQVAVSSAPTLAKTLIGCGFYYDRGAMMRSTLKAIEDFFGQDIHGIRRFGAASLDLCQVGCGQFGGFFEYKLSPWDFAAGKLFVEEAGGHVTNAKGDPLPLQKTSVAASNTLLHDAILEITRRHHP
jgi:myo-inositol-1(or 4)-monophosphatase